MCYTFEIDARFGEQRYLRHLKVGHLLVLIVGNLGMMSLKEIQISKLVASYLPFVFVFSSHASQSLWNPNWDLMFVSLYLQLFFYTFVVNTTLFTRKFIYLIGNITSWSQTISHNLSHISSRKRYTASLICIH